MDLAGRRIAYYSFTGLIDSDGVSRIATALNLATNSGCDEAYICMTSLGGFIGDGVFLYNHIRGLPIDVTLHNTGTIASVAVAVFVGADRRYCSPHGIFMIHPVTIGPFAEGVPWEKLQSSLAGTLAEEARTESILRERTRLSDEILSTRRVKDVHIVPGDALEYGLVHQIKDFALPKGNEILQI